MKLVHVVKPLIKVVTIILLNISWVPKIIAQKTNIKLSCEISSLPTPFYQYEKYIQKNKWVKHEYGKYPNSRRKTNHSEKIKSLDLKEIVDFVHAVNAKETFKLSLTKSIKDSLPANLLDNSIHYSNDTIMIDFEKFKQEYYKPDSTALGLIPTIDPKQIDGSWLSAQLIHQNDTLLTINKSYYSPPSVKNFKAWLIFYLINQKYDLLSQLPIKPYISDVYLIQMLTVYMEIT